MFCTQFLSGLCCIILKYFLGRVSTLAGGSTSGYVDSKGASAMFSHVYGLCFDEVDQEVLACDHFNHKIRKVSVSGLLGFFLEN